jgi:hypothetical protein
MRVGYVPGEKKGIAILITKILQILNRKRDDFFWCKCFHKEGDLLLE